MVTKINYLSDFKVEIPVYEAGEAPMVGATKTVPDWDFEAYIYTEDSDRMYRVGRRDGAYINIVPDEQGRMIVTMRRHYLMPGRLKVRVMLKIPDEQYPRGIRFLWRKYVLPVMLVAQTI